MFKATDNDGPFWPVVVKHHPNQGAFQLVICTAPAGCTMAETKAYFAAGFAQLGPTTVIGYAFTKLPDQNAIEERLRQSESILASFADDVAFVTTPTELDTWASS